MPYRRAEKCFSCCEVLTWREIMHSRAVCPRCGAIFLGTICKTDSSSEWYEETLPPNDRFWGWVFAGSCLAGVVILIAAAVL